MYRIAICDDDKLYRKTIRNEIEQQEITGGRIEYYEYNTGTEIIQEINLQHDLVFLDIQMPELNGNEVAKIIREKNEMAILVFCTNHNNLSPETIKVRPFRYIVKDSNNRNLKTELPDILAEMMKGTQVQYVTVSGRKFIKRIPINDILYISKIKHGSEITLFEGHEKVKLKCRETVPDLYNKLNGKGFEYAHNSYIVNLSNIIGWEKQTIIMKDNTDLGIARTYKDQLEERVFDFFIWGEIE